MSSTSSQELAVLQSGSSEPECGQSRSVSESPTASKSCAADGLACPSTTTFAPSQQSDLLPMESQSMPSLEDSPAKTSAMLVMALELKENDPGSGLSLRASLAHYDRESSSWRTSQRCLIEGWHEFSETWPKAGLMRSGACYRRAQWVPHIHDKGCSLWPTPTATDWKGGSENSLKAKANRIGYLRYATVPHDGGGSSYPMPSFVEALMGFPIGWTELTPSATPSCPKSQNGSDAA
jgi:hypothetical protein